IGGLECVENGAAVIQLQVEPDHASHDVKIRQQDALLRGALQSERGLRGEGGGASARLGAAENGQVTLFMLADFVRLQHAPQTFGRGGLGGDLERSWKKLAC